MLVKLCYLLATDTLACLCSLGYSFWHSTINVTVIIGFELSKSV